MSQGDALCVTGYDAVAKRPIVKRAAAENLNVSKTVYGVAEDDAQDGFVIVLIAGDVAGAGATGLGQGPSCIVITDITGPPLGQCL